MIITKVIDKNTKQAKQIINNIAYEQPKRLYQCYKNPSQRKEHIYNEILKDIGHMESFGCKILIKGIYTYNQQVFTYTIVYKLDDMLHILHITPTQNILINL